MSLDRNLIWRRFVERRKYMNIVLLYMLTLVPAYKTHIPVDTVLSQRVGFIQKATLHSS